MTRFIASLLLACLAGAGARAALADDTNNARPNLSHKQLMQECMAQARDANPNASNEELKKACREKVKSYNSHPSETANPPANPG